MDVVLLGHVTGKLVLTADVTDIPNRFDELYRSTHIS